MAIRDDFLKQLGDEIVRKQQEESAQKKAQTIKEQNKQGKMIEDYLDNNLTGKISDQELNNIKEQVRMNTDIYKELMGKASSGVLTETEANNIIAQLQGVTGNWGKGKKPVSDPKEQAQKVVAKALKTNQKALEYQQAQNKAHMLYEDLQPSVGTNYRQTQQESIKKTSPLTHVANTRGFTNNAKITSTYNGPEAPDKWSVPQEEFAQKDTNIKNLYNQGSQVNQNGDISIKKHIVQDNKGKVALDNKGNVQLNNYLVYDYETVGSQGTGTFAPTQVAFRGKVGGKAIEYNSFALVEGESKDYLEKLVNKMNSTDSKVQLTSSEKEQLMWLSDFRTTNKGKSLIAVHQDRDTSLPFSDAVKEQITQGFEYITGKTGNFENLKKMEEIRTDFLKTIGGEKNLSKLLFAGNNISGFDNDLLVNMLGTSNIKTLDLMSLAKTVLSRGKNKNLKSPLYGYSATDLARAFGVSEAEVGKIFMGEQGGKIDPELLSKIQGRLNVLTHSATGDVITEEKVAIGLLTAMFKNPKTSKMIENGLIQSKTFVEGMVYKTTAQRNRIHADEGAFDKDGNALTLKGNAWNFRMSKKGRNISFGETRKLANGRYVLSYRDVDFGTEYYMTGNSVNEVYDRAASMINPKNGMSMQDYQKSNQGRNNHIDKLFSSSNFFMTIMENIGDLSRLADLKNTLNSHEQRATVDAIVQDKELASFLQKNQIFKEIYKGLSSIKARGNGNEKYIKDMALKEIGLNMGAIAYGSYTPEDILRYATNKAGAEDFNSIKTQLRNFLDFASMGLDKKTYQNIANMINKAEFAMGNNVLFGIASTISEALANSGLNVDTSKNSKAMDNIKSTDLKATKQMIGEVTAAYEQQFVDNPISKMYKAHKNDNIGKMIDGSNKTQRLNKLGVKTSSTKTKGESDKNFTQNSMGYKLNQLNEVASKKGLQTTIVGSTDGKSLEVRLFNPKDIGSGNYASVTIPVADENGDIFYKGMKRVDTLRLDATKRIGTENTFDFDLVTSSEQMVDNLIRYLGYDTALNPNAKTLTQNLLEGNYGAANSFMRWATDEVFETSASLAEQKYLRELSEDDLEGGNAREMHAKRRRIEFKGAIDKVTNSIVKSNKLTQYSEKEISDFLLDYLYGATYGMQDFIASINGDLGAAFLKNGKFEELGKTLSRAGSALPQAQLESLKEAGYFLKQQMNFGGARELVPGSDINSQTKRAHTQGAHLAIRDNQETPNTIQRIRSGHEGSINDYDTADARQYNIAGINDGIIQSFINSQVQELEKQKPGKNTKAYNYLQELKGYQKNGMPSVHDDGVLLRQSDIKGLESHQNANLTISDEMLQDKNFLRFLNKMGISVKKLQSISSGGKLDIANKTGILNAGEYAWGTENSKDSHIVAPNDQFNYFVREAETGKLVLNYNRAIPMKEGVKLLAATTGGRHTINQIVSDEFMSRFANYIGLAGEELSMLTEKKDVSKTTVPNAIASYEYILNSAISKGTIKSAGELQNILNGIGALGRYLTVRGSGKNMTVESLAKIQYQPDEQGNKTPFGGTATYVDAKGNPIFTSATEAGDFVSQNIADLAEKLKVTMPTQGTTIMRSRIGVANETQWTRAIGFDTYENTAAYSPLQVDDKSRQTVLRSINNVAAGITDKETLEALEAYRNTWLEYGSQDKDPNYQKNIQIADSIKATLTNIYNHGGSLDYSQLKIYSPKDVSNIPTKMGTGGEKGTYLAEDYKQTPYAKLIQQALASGEITGKGEEFISLDFDGLNLKLPTGWDGNKSDIELSKVLLPIRKDLISNGKFNAGRATTPLQWEKTVGDLIRLKSLWDNESINEAEAYEQVQSAVGRLYTDMYNLTYNKEGSLNEAINKKRVGASIVGTASGLNMLSEMDLDSSEGLGKVRDYSDVSIGTERFQSILGASEALWKYDDKKYKKTDPNKQRLTTYKQNLGYLYKALMEEATEAVKKDSEKDPKLSKLLKNFKQVGLNQKTGLYEVDQTVAQQMIENITALTDISGQFGKYKIGVNSNLLRYPLTNDMGQPIVNVRADSSLNANTIKINSGMAKLLNADFDSDKIYLAMHMLEGSYSDYAAFKKSLQGQKIVAQKDRARIKNLSLQAQADYLSDNPLFFVDDNDNRISKAQYFKASAQDRKKYRLLNISELQAYANNGDSEIQAYLENQSTKIRDTGNYLYSGVAQDLVETLVAKRQFSHIGQFSNINTGLRRAFDDIGLGANATGNDKVATKNRVAGFLINAFDEFLEQDSISAKKVAGLLNGIMDEKNQLSPEAKREAIARAVNSLTTAYSEYQRTDYETGNSKSHWTEVFQKLQGAGLISAEKGLSGRQFDIALEGLKYNGVTEKQIAEVLGVPEDQLFKKDEFGMSRFNVSAEALSNLFTYADSIASSVRNGTNIMSRRFDYIKEGREATLNNIGKFIYQIQSNAYKRIDYDAKYGKTLSLQSYLVDSSLNTENGAHEYVNKNIKGTDLKLAELPVVSVTEAGGWIHPYEEPFMGETFRAAYNRVQDAYKFLSTKNQKGQLPTAKELDPQLQKEIANDLINPTLKNQLFDKLRTQVFGSERGTAIHGILEDFEKIMSTENFETKEDFAKEIKKHQGYKNAESQYKKINKIANDLGFQKEIFGQKDFQDLIDYADLYRQHRAEFAQKGDIGVFAEKSMGMALQNSNGQGFLLNGTADAITEKGITDYKIKGNIDGVLETWQLNSLWRMKELNMKQDLTALGHTLLGGEAITEQMIQQLVTSPNTDVAKLSPLMQEVLGYKEGEKFNWSKNVDNKKLNSYINMLNSYTKGEDPLLTIKWFRELNGKKIISNLHFKKLDDITYGRLTDYVYSTLEKGRSNFNSYFAKQQIADLIDSGRDINTMDRKSSFGYDETGKAVSPFDPLNMLQAATTASEVFQAYNEAKKKSEKDKILRDDKTLELLGLKFSKEELDPKKEPELFNAYKRFMENRGVTDQHTLNILKPHAVNPEDAIWNENQDVLKNKWQEEALRLTYGNDIVDYYKESLQSQTENYFAGVRNAAGNMERVKFEGDIDFTKGAIKGKLSEKDLDTLAQLQEFRHTHGSGSLTPSVNDIDQLKKIYDIQMERNKGQVPLERFIIDTAQGSLTIDVARIFELDAQLKAEGKKGFNWSGLKDLFNAKDLSPEKLEKSNFKDLFLSDSEVQGQITQVLQEQVASSPLKVQNLVEALKASGSKPTDIVSSDSKVVNEAIKKLDVANAESAKRLNQAIETNPILAQDFQNYTMSLEQLNKYNSYQNAQNTVDNTKLDFRGARSLKSKATKAFRMGNNLIDNLGIDLGDFTAQWKQDFEKALDGAKDAEEVRSVFNSYLGQIKEELGKHASKQAQKMGVQVDPKNPQTEAQGIQKYKEAMAQQETIISDKVSQLENEYASQTKFNMAISKGAKLKQTLLKAERGEMDPGEVDLKELREQYQEYQKIVADEGQKLGLFMGDEDANLKDADSVLSRTAKANDKTQNQIDRNNLKEGVSQFQLLQKMLNSNAPTKFTDSLNSSLTDLAKTIGKGDIQKGLKAISDQMSTEQKMSLLQQQDEQFNNTLAQYRLLDAKSYQIEQATTNYNRFGANTDKTSVINPWQDKIRTAQKTAIGLEQAKVQADLHKQMSQAGDSTTKTEFQARMRLNEQLMETNRQFLDTQRSATKGSLGVQKLAHSFKGMLNTAMQYGIVYRGAQSLIQQIYTIIGSIQEFDTIETQLRMLKEVNKDTAASMIADYRQIADEYGTTTAEVANASVTFLRQGRDIVDTEELIRQSAILAKVGFMEQTEAAELLTATLNGFKLEAEDAAKVVDLVSYTDQIAATSTQELMTAFQYVASSANVAGFEVEKLNAMIATSSETTRLSASTIGQAYKTIVSRLQQVKVGSLVDEETGEDISNVDKMLKQYGIDIMDINGKMKDGDVILEEFSKKWASWGNDTAKKREAVEALAGTRQGNIAMSLFDNWDRYEEILEDSTNNADGSAADKMEKNSESISASIARLQNALHDLASSSTVTGIYKWIVDLTAGLVKLSPVILTVAGAFLFLKGNGSGLNAVYNIQTGLVEKLKSSYMSLAHAQEYQQMQAQKALIAGNMKTISGGGMTAFVDPTTGAVGEVMNNDMASRTLAFQSTSTLKGAIQKYNIPVKDFDKNFDWNSLNEGQIGLQRARLSGQLDVKGGISGSQYVTNLNNILGSQVLKGKLSAPDLKRITDSIGAMADMGYSQEDISRGIRNKLFTKDASGNIKVNDNLKQNTEQFTKARQQYIKDHPESEAAKSQGLVEVGNNLYSKMTELITALDRNTQSNGGEVPPGNNTNNKNGSPPLTPKEELAQKNQLLGQSVEDYDLETTQRADALRASGRDPSQFIKNRNRDRDTFFPSSYDVGSEDTLPPTTSKRNPFSQWNKKMAQSQHWKNHEQKYTVGSGMIGMLGGMSGATTVASALGVDDSTASMIGMGTGMGLQMLATKGVVGAGISAVAGVALGAISMVKNHIEKVKEEQRQVFAEAEEKFKSIKDTLKDIDDIDFKTSFKELSQGVDSNGRNVSLTDEEYEQYREKVDKILEATPSLIKMYDEEGNALFDRNTLLEESIKLLKQEQEEKRKTMYGDSEINKTKVEDMNKDFQKMYGNKDNWLLQGWKYFNGQDVNYNVSSYNSYKDYEDAYWSNVNAFNTLPGYKILYGLLEKDMSLDVGKMSKEDWEKQHAEYQEAKKAQNAELANYYQNVISVDDTYKQFGEETQRVLNDYVKNLDYTSKDLDDYKEVEAHLKGIISLVKDNTELQNALNSYNLEDLENATIEESQTYKKAVLDALVDSGGKTNKEAIQIAQDMGIIDAKYNGTNISQASSFNTIVEEINEKIDKWDMQVQENNLEGFTQKELKELNNNWNSIVFEPMEDGFVDIQKAFDKWKQHVDDSFNQKINITTVSKYTEGVDNLMSAVKEYRNALLKDENGNYQFTLTPEVYTQLLKIKDSYNLSDEQMKYALENNENGEWELLGENVNRLVQVMLENAFKDRDFTVQELNMLDDNFRSQGILGAKETGYNEFLKKMATEGYIVFNQQGEMTINSKKKMNGEQQKLYDTIQADAEFINNKFDAIYVETASQLSSVNTALEYLSSYGFNPTTDDLEEFKNSLKDVTQSLGGFGSVVSAMSKSSLFTTDKDKMLALLQGKDKFGSLTELQNWMSEKTGMDFSGFTEEQIKSMMFTATAEKANEVQNRIKHYDDVNSTDALRVGQAEEEYRQSKRSVRDAAQQIADLKKEQELDDVTLIIDKLQLSLDKLNKTISTLSNTMDLLDANDFAGKFENISYQIDNSNQVLQTASENWDKLNAEYEKAVASGNGEAMQKIGEQMSTYSDSMTENAVNLLKLKKEAANLIVEQTTAEIEQISSVVNRELKMLDMHRAGLEPTKLNMVNMNLFTNPMDFLPKMQVSAIEKTRNETKQILEEEKKRQERLNEIKENSLQAIYDESTKKRTQDIADAQEDYDRALVKLQESINNKTEIMNENAKSSLEQLLVELQTILDTNELTGTINLVAKVNGTVKGEEQQMNSTQFANSKNLIVGDNKIITGKNEEYYGDMNQQWRDITDYAKKLIAGGENIVEAENIRLQSARNLGLNTLGYDGLDFSHKGDKNEYRQYLDYQFIKSERNKKQSSTDREADINLLDNYNGNLYILGTGNNLLKLEKEGNKWVARNQKGEEKQSWDSTYDLYYSEKDIYTQKTSSYAYATPNTPISNGPITVGEKKPEFVMFKDGSGAIFDKTTILNGSEVDFVSDASYANGGKNNGMYVSGSYADGGESSSYAQRLETDEKDYDELFVVNADVAEKTEEIEDKISTSGDNISNNIEETNKNVSQNIKDNNKNIAQNIKDSGIINETTIKNNLKNINTIINEGLKELTDSFKDRMEQLGTNIPQFGEGNQDVLQTALNEVKIVNGKNLTNKNKYTEGQERAWCGDFVDYVFKKAGVNLPDHTSVTNGANAMKKQGLYANADKSYIPQAGDILYFDWGNGGNLDHVAIVDHYDANSNKIYFVHGNNSKDTVAKSSTEWNNKVVGFGKTGGLTAYDSGTTKRNFSKYGIMSEKQGEYKINKQTGEWIYEPYETVVDTEQYDVVSAKDSQAIRNRRFEEGTDNQRTSDSYKEEYKNRVLIPQMLTDSFVNGYNNYYYYLTKNTGWMTTGLQNGISMGNLTSFVNKADDRSWDWTSKLKINSNVEGLQSAYKALKNLKELLPEAIADGTNSYKAFQELYNELQEQAESYANNIQKIAEENTERYKTEMTITMANMEKMFALFSKKIQDIDNQIQLLNAWQVDEKIILDYKKLNEQRNKLLTLEDKMTFSQRSVDKSLETLKQGFATTLGDSLKNDLGLYFDDLINADGQINQGRLNEINQTLNAYLQSQGETISSEVEQFIVNMQTQIGNITHSAAEVVHFQEQIAQETQALKQIVDESIEVYKANVDQSYEQRKSLYKAVIDNTSALKELVDMSGALLKDTNYLSKAENMAQSYNTSVKNVQAYRNNDQRLRNEQAELATMLAQQGYNVAEGFTSAGELVAGSAIAKQLNQWVEKIQDAANKGNWQTVERLTTLKTAVEKYGEVLAEKNENQQSLQNTLVSTLEAQKQLIEQGQKYLQQYMEEMVSQYKANTDTNSLIGDRLSSIRDALGDFDRVQQISVMNGQLRNNKNDRNNLMEQQTSISVEREKLIREMQQVIPKINVNSLFTDKGEVMSSAYNEAKKSLDDMLENGAINLQQYTTWMQRVDQVGELKKEELDIEDQIIDNYQKENQLIEEKTNKIKESYDWQITKMSSLLELTNKRFETENKIFELRADLDKELRSAKQSMQWLTKSERIKIFNEEDYTQLYQALDAMDTKTQAYYDDYYNQMMNLTEDTLYQQEFITAEYERRMELVEAEYALTQKRVDLEKEQLKLKNIASEKSERMYVNGAWRQVANTEELISASESVADAEKDYELAQQEKLQKIQQAQMNEYIDSLKQIQAALENSTKSTNNTEEELINRLTNTVEKLIGSDSTQGALNLVIDNLTTDLHNYEQVTKTIVNVELKDAVQKLAEVTNDLQTEINIQQSAIKQDKANITDTMDYFNQEVKKIQTDNLARDLSNLSLVIEDVIKTFSQYTKETDINRNEEIYLKANEITYLKSNYETAQKQYLQAQENNDTEKMTEAKNIMETSAKSAKVYYTELINAGYKEIAHILQNMNSIEAWNFKEALYNTSSEQWGTLYNNSEWGPYNKDNPNYKVLTDEELLNYYVERIVWAKDEYEKGNQDFGKSIAEETRKSLSKLKLNGVEQQVINMLNNMNAEEAQQFSEKLAKGEYVFDNIVSSLDNSLSNNVEQNAQIIKENWGIVQTNKETVASFSDGYYSYKVSVDKETGAITVFDNANNKFEGTVDSLSQTFKEQNSTLSQILQEAISLINTSTNSRSSYSTSSGGSSVGSPSAHYEQEQIDSMSTEERSAAWHNADESSKLALHVANVRDKSSTHTFNKDTGLWTKKASGTISAERGVYNIDEIGKEIVIPSGRLRMMEYGDQVIPHNISENLLKWGTLNPSLLRSLSPEHTNNITNNNKTEVKIENVNLENVTNGTNFMPELNRYLQRTNSLS